MDHWEFPAYPPAPLSPSPKPRKVVVVGAGAAGLMAARMLVAADYDVTVLEGSSRPGGRIRTLRAPFSKGLYVDAGAAFIPCNHTFTVGLAKDCGLVLQEMAPAKGVNRSDLQTLDYVMGTCVPDPHNATEWPVDLSRKEQGKSLGDLLKTYVGDAFQEVMKGQNPRTPGWPPPELAHLDGLTFGGLLKEKGASEGAIQILRLGLPDLWGEGVDSVSALYVLRDVAMSLASGGEDCVAVKGADHAGIRVPRGVRGTSSEPKGTPQFAVAGGNDQLPAKMAEELGDRVWYDAKVRTIEVDAQGRPQIMFDGKRGRQTIEAERVILAVPASVLGRIQVFPTLCEAKRRAFAKLGMTSVTRVFLEFEERIWEQLGYTGGCYTDLPEESGKGTAPGIWINNQTYAQNTTRGILEAYTVGGFARLMADHPQTYRVETILAQMERVFPGARKAFSGKAGSWTWSDDPGASAGYCYFLPGQLAQFASELGRAEGPIHFAGDHTSALPGWMQGAFESGLRAAREIREAL